MKLLFPRRWIALLLLMPMTSLAFAADFRAGRDYDVLLNPVQTSTGEQIEVLELFWYGCPHCFSMEPMVKKWVESAPEDVGFRRMPAVLGKSWRPHALAYYTAEALGVLERVHVALFEAIHVQRRRVNDEDAFAELFAAQGVSEGEFRKVYNSFGVQTKVQQAGVRVRSYRITGVPAIIVNGKYRVKAGQKTFEIVDFLVEKERAERAGSAEKAEEAS